MKTLLPITCLLLAACPVVRAGNAPSATAPTVDTTSSAIPGYTPKTRSVFSSAAAQHNPFWPIGWVKIDNESASDSSAPYVPRVEDFVVSTILMNDPPMAVINGKDMAEGEVASLPINGQNVVVQLMAVQDGRVVLRWQNQNLVVPIHRDEDITAPVADLH